jgi:Tfp pilus assembly protein PilN
VYRICGILIWACILLHSLTAQRKLGEEVLLVNSSLNLASKPFNNRLLPWALTTIILFVSLVGLIIVVRLTTVANKQAAVAQVEINALKQEEKSLLDRAQAVKIGLTPEQQEAVPSAHVLIDRKKFSWSRLLADLESSLPNNVRVSRIAVRDIASHGDQTVATLDLALFTKNPATISEMIAAMHEEGVFQLVLRAQNLAKGRGEQGTEYEFDVIYRSRSGYRSESVAGVTNPQNPSEAPR